MDIYDKNKKSRYGDDDIFSYGGYSSDPREGNEQTPVQHIRIWMLVRTAAAPVIAQDTVTVMIVPVMIVQTIWEELK